MARLFRILALAMAIAGIADPALTVSSRTRPEVALVAGDHLPDAALVDRIARSLEPRFTVIRGPSIGAAATVAVGYELPEPAARDVPRAFAVIPQPRDPFVWVSAATTPARAQIRGDIPVTIGVRALAAKGRQLTVSIRNSTGVLDLFTRAVATDDGVEVVQVHAMSASVGRQDLTVTATVEGAATTDEVTVPVTVHDARRSVLSFDRRPSWMSTFVRRVLETDPRFIVTSRVATTRAGAALAGDAPASLADATALSRFHAITIGAPQDLSSADVAGLDAYMREHGGAVILLLDEAKDSDALRRLTGVRDWAETERAEPAGDPRASHWFLPREMPEWAEARSDAGGPSVPPSLRSATSATPVTSVQPSLWSTAVGRGRLLVSGALDAWRFRGGWDAFDRFWERTITEVTEVAEVTERRDGVAEGGALRDDERALIRQWTSSHGGRTVAESETSSLVEAMTRTLAPSADTRVLHPMRSAWWIVPFGLLLGAEWWLRRRSGQR